MNAILFILTNSANKIPQMLHETESLPLELIEQKFVSKDFEVNKLSFETFINSLNAISNKINGSFFVYASSQYTSYKSSIEDILLYIKNQGGILVPSFESFVAHENKFFQALEGIRLGLKMPDSTLVNTSDKLDELLNSLNYPQVAKLASGYGSTSVQLVDNSQQAVDFIDNNFSDTIKRRKNIFERNREIKRFKGKYPLKTGKVLFQRYLHGADHDWKVLVFGRKIFVLKRFFRDQDFRASGSGNFDFNACPSEKLLQFAYEHSQKVISPFVSLDVLESKSQHYLLEYQCVHFGLMAAINSNCHYEFCGTDNFVKKTERINIDDLITNTLYEYIISFYSKSSCVGFGHSKK